MPKLTNPVESMNNVQVKDKHYRPHRTRIGDLVAPDNKWSLEGLAEAVKSR